MLTNVPGNKINELVSDYVVFDLETTGVSPYKDEVIEISAVKVISGQVVDEFSSLVNPGRLIPIYASQINGIYDSMVVDAPKFDAVLADFVEFIGDYVLVGHNIQTFDMKFIYRDCQKYFGKVPNNDFIDTLPLSRKLLPDLSHHKLVSLADHFEISAEGAHRALNDCHMNQKVYEKLRNSKID